MSDNLSFGQWLKRQRRLLDLNQEEFAARIGYAVTTVRRLESDDLRPSKELARKLADTLNLPASERPAFVQFARGVGASPPPAPHESAPLSQASIAPPTPRHNLPLQVSSFVGRDQELAALQTLLAASRLITLTGVGGTGKTRLALEMAYQMSEVSSQMSDDGRQRSEVRGQKTDVSSQRSEDKNHQSSIINHPSSIVHRQFSDGVWLVDLAPLADPDLVVVTIAQTVGLRDRGQRAWLDVLKDYLRDKRLLLILDNFEHVLDAAPALIDLLAVVPHLTILVTSRIALRLRGEKEFFVPPLALPDARTQGDRETRRQGGRGTGEQGGRETGKEGQRAIEDISHLTPHPSPLTDHGSRIIHSEAVRLFVERARDVKPSFTLDETTAPVVGHICAALDGLPLAIELAAARIRIYTPQAMLERLSGAPRATPLHFLTDGPRDLPARQQTLRETIAWSYHLLSPAQQRLFRQLGVFAGGFNLPSAAAVAGDDAELEVADGLEALVAHSLVKTVEGVAGEPRFTLLETLRAYALEQLEVCGEAAATRDRHLAYYAILAEEGEWGLHGPQQRTWLDRLEMEHDNFRAALAWSLSDTLSAIRQAPGAMLGLRLAGSLGWFWWYHSHLNEGINWLIRLLAHPDTQARTATRARALSATHRLEANTDLPRTRDWREESIAIYREVDDKFGLAMALRSKTHSTYFKGDLEAARVANTEVRALFEAAGVAWGMGLALEDDGNFALADGDYAQARQSFEESAALFQTVGDRWHVASSLSHIAMVELLAGNFVEARRLFADRIAVVREIGTRSFLSIGISLMGHMALEQGDYEGARAIYTESLALAEEWRDKIDIARASYGLGIVNQRQGDLPAARTFLGRSLILYREVDRERSMVFCLLGLAEVEAAHGRRERAARLCGAAVHLLDIHPPALLLEMRYHYQGNIDALLAQFTDPLSQAHLAEGEAMTLEQAIAYALEPDPA